MDMHKLGMIFLSTWRQSRWGVLGLALWAGVATTAFAQDAVAWRDDDVRRLAAHLTWQRLLHMDERGRSEVLSPDFFLSPQGAHDAEAELRADLQAWSQPWPEDANQHPRCRFPARYLWLSRHLNLPGYQEREPRCARLQEWARLDHLQSISVYLVSGYLGNPASTFGHALIKFNTDDGQASGGLMDVSVNYGAMVPPKEPTLLYVLKGLFGGYRAAFSDQLHYTNDVVYSRSEFRDMWDYRLALTPAQRTLFAYHVAEMVGRQFTYLFLNKNCGLRIAEMLELATDQRLVRSALGWYVPVEMFNALHEQDTPPGRMLMGPPRFVPSAERQLQAEFARLNPTQLDTAQAIIRDDLQRIVEHLQPLPPAERLDVLDALLAYQAYLVAGQGGQQDEPLRRAKDRILLARLHAPTRTRPELVVPPQSSPAQGHAPMLTGLGWAHDGHQGAARLRWAPFLDELGGFHGLDRAELAVFDTTVDVSRQGRATLQTLDLIRVRKMSTQPAYLDTDNPWSWQVQLGVRHQRHGDAVQRQNHFTGGLGWSRPLGNGLGFVMWTGSVQSGSHHFSTGPEAAATGSFSDQWRWSVRASWRQDLGAGGLLRRSGAADLSWRVGKDQVWRAAAEWQDRPTLVVAFQQYW
ncbi:MAG: hypothetical protein RI907_2892 [Pseudomonadota bacterium]|jgi:hypothetical protein